MGNITKAQHIDRLNRLVKDFRMDDDMFWHIYSKGRGTKTRGTSAKHGIKKHIEYLGTVDDIKHPTVELAQAFADYESRLLARVARGDHV